MEPTTGGYIMEKANANKTKIFLINEKQLSEAMCPGNDVRHKMCVIVGPKGFVVTDNECIHSFHRNGDFIELSYWQNKEGYITMFPAGTIRLTIHQLLEFTTDAVIDWKEWIHYFGIKDRMYRNLQLLKKSVKEIGAEVEFPAWEQ